MVGAEDSVAAMEGSIATHDNDEEETTTESKADQPLSSATAAATTSAEPAAASDILDAPPSSGDSPDSIREEKEVTAKKDIGPETTSPGDIERMETSPGEKKIDDSAPNEFQPLSGNDDILLNFGDSGGGVTDGLNMSNSTSASNEFDLLGFSPAETANPSPSDKGAAADGTLLDNQPSHNATEMTTDNEPIHDILGMPSTQQPNENPEVAYPVNDNIKPPNLFAEKEVEKYGVGGGTVVDSHIELDNANENEDVTAEPVGRGDDLNQSQNENSSAPEQVTLLLNEKDEVAPPTDFCEGNDTQVDADTLEKYDSKSESNAQGEGVDIMSNNTTTGHGNENKGDQVQVQEEQSNSSDDLHDVGSMPAELETHETESETHAVMKDEVTDRIPGNGLENQDNSTSEADGNAPAGEENGDAEERTQEEEEWLSMGLGLGDALRQIVALTEERDSASALCQGKDGEKEQVEALLVEVQSRLMVEMNIRAEFESEVRQARETLKSREERLATYESIEDELGKAQASLVQVVSEKSKIELEVQKLREMRDESEQKEVVLSNRLNEAKKKEANRSTAAGRLEADNENLRDELQRTKEELENTSRAKAKLENNMEKLKAKAVERVKQAETALVEERELNEERKKKMKVFVETKADELRESKESANDMQKELEETRASLRSSRDREEASQKELETARFKHREVQRDMERMKRNSEQLHRVGNDLEQELSKSATETEEHKKKRSAAKHEIMQMVRTLEAERTVSSKLREAVKFTFTPKALSQTECLTDCLRDFESELERLAAKMGKTLTPSPESSEQAKQAGAESPEINGSSRKSKKTRASKAGMDTERLISNLEQETQHVSKGIMELVGSVERMRSLLDDDSMFGCVTYLTNILAGSGEARHQRLGDGDANEEGNSDQFV